jgi:hypothetical protein
MGLGFCVRDVLSTLFLRCRVQVIALAEDIVDANKATSNAAADQQAAADDTSITAVNGTTGPELSALRIASLAVMGKLQHTSWQQLLCMIGTHTNLLLGCMQGNAACVC